MKLFNHLIILITLSIYSLTAHTAPKPIIWSHNPSEITALDWSGSNSNVVGDIHSNSGIRVSGSNNSVQGLTQWVTVFDGGVNNSFNPIPQQINTKSWPYTLNLVDYQPGGTIALAAGVNYYDKSSTCDNNGKWQVDNAQGNEIAAGLYWVPCDVKITASNLTAEISIISTGKIEISGSNLSDFSSYVDGILFWTELANNGSDVLKIAGSNSTFSGFMLAQYGNIEVSASQTNLHCGIAADRVKLKGSNLEINHDGCNTAPIADDQSLSIDEDTTIAIVLTATDAENDALTYSIINQPSNGTLTGTPPNLIYTPNANYFGTDEFTFIANDGEIDSQVATVNITVNQVNEAPIIISTPAKNINEYETYNYDVDAIDPDADNLVYSELIKVNTTNINIETGVLTSEFDYTLTQGLQNSNYLCRKASKNITSIDVNEKILWPLQDSESIRNLDTAPIVVKLIDSNNDGLIDEKDVSVIVFVAYGWGSELIAIRADTSELVFRVALNLLHGSSPLAAADIDQDGLVEIIGVNISRNGIIVFENDGTIKYEAPIDTILIGGGYAFPTTIADLEGDGTPEILVAGSVLNAAGDSLWSIPNSTGVWGAPIVADIDNDGVNEVITGGIVYNAMTGEQIWKSPIANNGRFFTALANLDEDTDSELIFVVSGIVYAYEHSGEEIWSSRLLSGGHGGAPTVGQVDGNTVIGVAGGRKYNLFAADGSLVWTQSITDRSSSSTGSTMFDFNGDGRVEVVYADERYFRIYDAATGTVLYQLKNRSHTSIEYPVIADIDNNGSADILLPQNGGIGAIGLRTLSGVVPWVDTRSIWNQYAYNINNINDDGSIPINPVKSWLTHNTYRLNTFPDRHPLGLADLAIFDLHLDEANGTVVNVLAYNRGLAPTSNTSIINIYNGDPNHGGTLLGTIAVPILAAGEQQTLTLDNLIPSSIDTNLYAKIDENNDIVECIDNNNSTSSALFAVKATDPSGLFDSQRFTVAVENINEAPSFNNNTLKDAKSRQIYTDTIIAQDPDIGDALQYKLITAPTGMQINEITGQITWIPMINQIGSHTISVQIQDLSGTAVSQSYTIQVLENDINRAPFIISAPVIDAHTTQDYTYQIRAIDYDGDMLSYSLLIAPQNMEIDPINGLITWLPTSAQIGVNEVLIAVSDNNGAQVTQAFNILVSSNTNPNNQAPIITSTPLLGAQQNHIYEYQILASDVDGDTLSYGMIDAPSDMVIDANTGLLSWTPLQIGQYAVSISVTDQQATIIQGWFIEVTEYSSTLSADVFITPQVALPGQDINLTIVPNGFVSNLTITATVDTDSINLDNNHQAMINSDKLGLHNIQVTLSDDNGSIDLNYVFFITDTIDLNVPTIDIITPTDGGTATGLVDIVASIQDENLSQWKLSYRTAQDGENAPRTEIASGTTNVDNQSIATFDTSLLRNGIYVFVLEAVDVFGNYNNIANSIFIEGDLKIGHFQIAFQDLNIPVAGIPVTISRSYDTRNRNADEAFGKGWEIGYQSLQLTESRIPGLGWYQTTEFYNIGPVRLPRYCIESIGDRLVSVRMPDGGLEKFKVKAKTLNPTSEERGNCQDIVPPAAFTIKFIPQGDTNSQLRAEGDNANYRVRNGNIEPLADIEMYDPNKYTLTLLDGTIYSIDQGFNLTDIETTDGNSIKFTYNGIEHSNGYAVQFIRDSQDRIRFIQKPNGDRIEYTYNANGDLASHTDLMGNTTTFTYILDHYLEDIIDPRGITVARNEYDNDGRLVAHIDANGNRIEYTHDIQGRTETIKDRNGNSSVFVYDNAGSVIAETNPLGETTFHEYNAIRLETKRIDPLGNETTWTYDNFGNQLTETDSLGNTTTSTYTNRGEIITQTDANGDVIITNEYGDQSNPFDGLGNIKKVTDALGNTTEFHWAVGQDADLNTVVVNSGFTDAKGNRYEVSPLTQGTNSGITGTTTDLNGLKTESTYDDEARPLTESQIITDANDVEIARYTTTFVYNDNGDIIKTTDALGNFTQTEYNSLNKVSATIDANGNRTTYEFDNRGNPSKTTYPDATFDTITYDLEGNTIATTDRVGRVTKTIYDAVNRVVQVIMPDDTPADDSDNPRTTNTYDTAGRLTTVTDALGNSTSYGYDSLGRRTTTTDVLSNQTSFVYNSLGQRTQSTDALARITNFQYNDLGNLTQTTFANSTLTSTTYDELSRKISQTDLAGRTTNYEYSNAGNLTAVIDLLNQRTEYTYDQRGNKITQKDANNNVTSWTYDELSRVASRTLPEGQVETFTYNTLGNLASKTDFNGDTTTYAYNNLNQLTLTTYADASTVISTYTTLGQIASITQAQGANNNTTSYQYDSDNRLSRIDYPTGNFIAYLYDDNGNRTQVQTASQTVAYTFDALNRSQTITDTSGITTYAYDNVGNRATQSNANGTVATYQYDYLNRLIDLTHTDSSNNVIANYAYTLGANGNRLSITEATGRIVDYTYDDLYRLITETITDTINGNHYNEFAYDAVGNRQQQFKDGITTTYIYNNNDQIQSETENTVITSYAYDNNGNTLSKTVDAVLDTSYSYDNDNRMVQAVTPTSTITNTYDAGGIRQSQTVDGILTNYLVDQNRSYAHVLEEQNDLFIPQTTYVYGDDLISQTNNQGTHTFGYDGLGSTRILTDVVGVVQNAYGYEAFGEVDYQLGTIENNYLFTGEQYDNNVGFYYLRARFYNPQNGRFVNMDTFNGLQFEPKSLHKYLYAHADPINNIDPTGNVTLIGTIRAISVAASLVTSASVGYGIGTIFYRVQGGASLLSNANLKTMAGIGLSVIPLSWLTKIANLSKAALQFEKLGFAIKIYDTNADYNKIFHFLSQIASRGINPKQALEALAKGKKWVDTKTGAVAHVLGENVKGSPKILVVDNVIVTGYTTKLTKKFVEL